MAETRDGQHSACNDLRGCHLGLSPCQEPLRCGVPTSHKVIVPGRIQVSGFQAQRSFPPPERLAGELSGAE